MVKFRHLIKIEYIIFTGRFLACPFASLGASARNDCALVVNGVRRGLRPRLTPFTNNALSF
jgi:hypothetical protein